MFALAKRMPLTCFVLRMAAELLLLCSLLAAFAQADVPRDACVLVTADSGRAIDFGSGTLVDATADGAQGLVVTCWHVVRDAPQSVTFTFPNGRKFGGKLVAHDADADLAAYAISTPPVAAAPVGAVGQAVELTGYAGGQTWRVLPARQSGAYAGRSSGVRFGGEVANGMSGGGVFNDRGEWCGVVWGAADGESYTTTGQPVANLLARCGIRETAQRMICTPNGCVPVYSTPIVRQPPVSAPAASSPCRGVCEGLAARLDTLQGQLGEHDALLAKVVSNQETITNKLAAVESREPVPGPPGPRGPQGPAGQDGAAGRDATIDDETRNQIVRQVLADLPPITVVHVDPRTGQEIGRVDKKLGETLTLKFGAGDPVVVQPAR